MAAAKSGEAPTLATVWTDPEHTTLARDAGHTGPHGARLHRCDAPRQARAQTGSEWADVRGWGRLLTGTGFFLLFSFWFWMVKLLELDGSGGCITVTILKATELDFEKGEFYGM